MVGKLRPQELLRDPGVVLIIVVLYLDLVTGIFFCPRSQSRGAALAFDALRESLVGLEVAGLYVGAASALDR